MTQYTPDKVFAPHLIMAAYFGAGFVLVLIYIFYLLGADMTPCPSTLLGGLFLMFLGILGAKRFGLRLSTRKASERLREWQEQKGGDD